MLEPGKVYAYQNLLYAQPLRVGYFLGCVEKEIPNQSYNFEGETGIYWVFGTSPRKDIKGKYNDSVLDCDLGAVFSLEEVTDFR